MTVPVPAPTSREPGRWSWFAPPRRPSRRPSATGRDRITALDGLRALGLALVVGFHFGVGGMGGGFFGVDLFYVLSGFLITGLLLGEWSEQGRVALGTFWARRARRLLPALVVMVVAVSLYIRFAEPAGLFPGFRMDALSALFYFSNWWQIHEAGNYFAATGAVSPLTHTWSLAVEEQFYLVWPLVVVVALRACRTRVRGVATVGAVAVAGALASTALMAVRYGDGADVTRLYFGTDTHAQSVLVGAALACVLTLVQTRRGGAGMAPRAGSTGARVALSAIGLVGLVGLVVASATLTGNSALTYRGGFLLVALASAAVILAAVTVPLGPLARAFSLRPLVWLGTISYGAYLWHFPVAVFLDGARTGLVGVALLVVRIAATLALSTASWVLVERPVILGTFWRRTRAVLPALGVLGITCIVVVAATAVPAQTTPDAAALRAGASGMSPDLRAALAARGAFGSHPVRFLLVGDSVALTLGVGLTEGSVHNYGVKVFDGGLLGCDLDDLPLVSQGVVQPPTTLCVHWPQTFATGIVDVHPDVVGILIGRWLIQDHVDHGRRVHVGQPAWDAHLEAELLRVVQVVSARGARVVLFTLPDFDPPGEQPDGAPWPENDPSRVTEFNRILRSVASRAGDVVTLVDLHRMLDPGGSFASVVDGVRVRWPDGIHISRAGGVWLQPRILPTVAALGVGAPLPKPEPPGATTTHATASAGGRAGTGGTTR